VGGYIDLHTHLLPGIDDGSRTAEQSTGVLKAMAAAGVHTVALTPHVAASELADHRSDAVEHRDETWEILKAEAPDVPRLVIGFEVMLDELMPIEALADRRLSLAGSRYFLVEFPLRISPEDVVVHVQHVCDHDVVPVVAHPERYWHCSLSDIAEWWELGARMMVDATTLIKHGPRGRCARRLVERGLADLVASDNHGGRRNLVTAVRYLEERGFHEAARLLAVENPRAVVEDGEMAAAQPLVSANGWLRRVLRMRE